MLKINEDVTLTIKEGKKGKCATVTLIGKHSRNLHKWLKQRQALTDERIYPLSISVRLRAYRTAYVAGNTGHVDKYTKLARMGDVTPHRFHHSFYKNLANSGASKNHKKFSTTDNIQITVICIDPSR